MIYFDHCATTPPYPEVLEAYREVMERFYGNPSSLHRLGVEADRLVEKSRESIAALLQVRPQEIVFTSCGTESSNLAIKGTAQAFAAQGGHFICTQIEHSSVYESFRQLEQSGFRVTYLPPDGSGAVSLEALEAALEEDTRLVSVMHVNNETGRIQPVEQMGQLLRRYPKLLFHVDAVQSIGKIPVKPAEWGIDLLTLSAHKFRGPKGTGALYVRDGIRLAPLLAGGGQEQGRRSGTQHVPGIVGMAKALRLALESEQAGRTKLHALREQVIAAIRAIPELQLTGLPQQDGMAPHIIHFTFPGMNGEVMVHMLEKHQVYVSTQSACGSKTAKPSRVLQAMGFPPDSAGSGIRISLSADHTEADIAMLCKAIRMSVDKLKPMVRKLT